MRVFNDDIGLATSFATTNYSDTFDLRHIVGYAVRLAYTVDASTTKDVLADTQVNITTNALTVTAHGWTTARAVRASSTATLPAPLLVATDYYVIVVDANTIKLAASVDLAVAGTPIDLTTIGTAASTHTLTPNALAASWTMQASLDGTAWESVGTPTTITVTASALIAAVDVMYPYVRAKVTVTGGQLSAVSGRINAKGFGG